MGIHKTIEGFSLTKAEDGRLEVRTRCHQCGSIGAVNVKSSAHANVTAFIHRKFREVGWSIGNTRRRDLCPTCLTDGDAPKCEAVVLGDALEKALDSVLFHEPPTMQEEKEVTSPTQTDIETKTNVTPMPANNNFKKILKDEHLVTELLRKHLSPDGNLWKYADGYTDERVAKESGLADACTHHIAAIRRFGFGQLKRAPRLAGPIARIKALDARIDALEKMALKLIK